MDGYIRNLEIYQGKKNDLEVAEDADSDDVVAQWGLGEKVVCDMVDDLHGKHHQVYMDNYFTSIPLMEYLKVNGVDACGTIRSNRKALPAGMKADKDLNRGEFDYMVSKQGIVYFKWNDNSTVHAVSNFHGTDASVIQRTQKDGTKSQFPCPTAIKAYNEYMGGDDKADILCGIYDLDRKARKWWHRIFFGIIEHTIVNAMVAYQKIQGESITTLQFSWKNIASISPHNEQAT